MSVGWQALHHNSKYTEIFAQIDVPLLARPEELIGLP